MPLKIQRAGHVMLNGEEWLVIDVILRNNPLHYEPIRHQVPDEFKTWGVPNCQDITPPRFRFERIATPSGVFDIGTPIRN